MGWGGGGGGGGGGGSMTFGCHPADLFLGCTMYQHRHGVFFTDASESPNDVKLSVWSSDDLDWSNYNGSDRPDRQLYLPKDLLH